MTNQNAAVAAIQYALDTDESTAFLRCWMEGNFAAIRKEWPDAPEAVFVGADPLHPKTKIGLEHELRQLADEVFALKQKSPQRSEIDQIKERELGSCYVTMRNLADNIENGDYWPKAA